MFKLYVYIYNQIKIFSNQKLFMTNRIQSESRSRERLNGEQQKRSLSYGDKLNGGSNNNRRLLPTAPANNTYSTTKKLDQLLEGDTSDLKFREPTPDYDTQSMVSNFHPAEGAKSDSKVVNKEKKRFADNNLNNNALYPDNRASSTKGSNKDISDSFPHHTLTHPDGSDKTNGKMEHDEKGRILVYIFLYQLILNSMIPKRYSK